MYFTQSMSVLTQCNGSTVCAGIVVVAAVAEEGEANANPTLLDMDQAANSELIELRVQLDRERGLRMILEDQVRSLETQLYPERIREITQQVQLQYHHHQKPEVNRLSSSF